MNKHKYLLIPFLLAGCGSPQAEPTQVANVPTIPLPELKQPLVAKLTSQDKAIPAPPLPPVVAIPLVPKSLQIAATPPVALPSQTGTPRVRVSTLDSGELPMPIPSNGVVSMPQSTPKPPLPSPPKEVVPYTLGFFASEDLSQIKVKENPKLSAPGVVNPGAADVPTLSLQLPDRASLEDPTSDITRSRTVETAFPLPETSAPVLRLRIPDPFEFTEQLKGKLPERKFATEPTIVPPAR